MKAPTNRRVCAQIAPESTVTFRSMENSTRNIRFSALHISIVLAITALAGANMAHAKDVDATRARIAPASLVLPASPSRACWARYSATSAASSNGVMEEVAFRVPCPETVSRTFIASLQRALQARGYFYGSITGQPDSATRDAVRAFQRENGFDSPILTLATAQKLGLSPRDFGQN